MPRRDDAIAYTLAVGDLQTQVDIELGKLLDGLNSLSGGLRLNLILTMSVCTFTVYLRVLVEEFIPEQNTTQTIRLIHG